MVLAIAGTPKDENVENRPKKPQPLSEAGIASITLLSGDDSEDEEELEVFETSVARVEQTRMEDRKWKNPTKIMKRTES